MSLLNAINNANNKANNAITYVVKKLPHALQTEQRPLSAVYEAVLLAPIRT